MRTIYQLLAGSLILLALTFCTSRVANQKGAENSFSMVFLTDIHLFEGRGAVEGLKKAIDTVNALQPDFILTGGDLVMDALQATAGRADSLYTLYTSGMKQLKAPVFNTVGNHEILGWEAPEKVDSTSKEFGLGMYRKHLGEPYYSFEHKGWKFFVLCSPQRKGNGYYGSIDTAQLRWIRNELAKTDSSMPLAISVHIPFITVSQQLQVGSTAANPEGLVTSNGKEVLDLFAGYKLRLVLQGHLHFFEAIETGGTVFITGGAVCSAWWKGRNNELEEGFVHLQLTGDQVSWHYVDYGWEANP